MATVYTGTTRLVGGAIQPALGVASALLTPVKPGPVPVTLPLPHPPPAPPPTSLAALDAALAGLQAAAAAWSATDLRARAHLFRATMRTAREVGFAGHGWREQEECFFPRFLHHHHPPLVTTSHARTHTHSHTHRPSCPPPAPPSRPRAPTARARARK